MTSTTPRSGLPLLAAAQAQKHVTHNEALVALDAIQGMRILDRDLSAPPASPADGDAYLVKATATGDWTGQDGNIAYCIDGAWNFYAPFAGLAAYVADENALVLFDGSAWAGAASLLDFDNLAKLGINTAADATNKLAVKSSALLFDNIGGGVQAKLNKNAAGDTASLLYQTSYSGRAEFGLCGDDNFHLKVSADGSAWTDAVVIDKTSGAATFAAAVKAADGTSALPAYAFAGDAATGLFRDTANNNNIGVAFAGAQLGFLGLSSGGTAQLSLWNNSTTNNQIATYNSSASTAPTFTIRRGRGTFASPALPATGDQIGRISWQPLTNAGSNSFSNAAQLRGILSETASVDGSHCGMQFQFWACAVGSGTLSEIARLDNESGLSMFGANSVIDKNRILQLRSTTIAGAIAPSAAGKIAHHSDAQGGAGEVALDTGSAYRHAGQAAVKRLTSDADASYIPRADGRILRDLAALTADRKLTLSTTNVSDGHVVQLSRRGSSGGFNRKVYQADGTTLIASLADNTCADFIYDAVAAAWFQK